MKRVSLFLLSMSFFSCGAVFSQVVNGKTAEMNENKTFTVNGVSFEMVEVKGGTFTIGCTSDQGDDCYDRVKPSHQVTLNDYYIGETEVTQELWKAVMGSNPSYFTGDNLPVEKVSWTDCQKFISKLNELTGETFRLPTEAEWEYAARGGNKSRGYKYSGSNDFEQVGWNWNNSGDKKMVGDPKDVEQVRNNHCRTHSVKQKLPNELGICDMSGNVSEWCSDWFGDYSADSQNNPVGPSNGSYRVLRGGSWHDNARGCCVSNRFADSPDNSDINSGLRLIAVH